MDSSRSGVDSSSIADGWRDQEPHRAGVRRPWGVGGHSCWARDGPGAALRGKGVTAMPKVAQHLLLALGIFALIVLVTEIGLSVAATQHGSPPAKVDTI